MYSLCRSRFGRPILLRISFGTRAVGWDNLVYGLLLVIFIIFLPKGILGSVLDRLKTQPKPSGTK